MPKGPTEPFTLAFVGYTTAELAEGAAGYEDAVLPLLADHGARLVYRGRRAGEHDAALPFEVHLLWFPGQAAFDAYFADPRRLELLEQFGDVFTSKQSVVVDTIVGIGE